MAIGKNKRKRLRRQQERDGQQIVRDIINTPMIDEFSWHQMAAAQNLRYTQTFRTNGLGDAWYIAI